MHRCYTLIAVASVVTALAAAGCGGSERDSEASGEPAATMEESTPAEETTTEEQEATEESGESVERVSMRMIAYKPKTITIPVNTTIRWTNDEAADHTVTSSNGGSSGRRSSTRAARTRRRSTSRGSTTTSARCIPS